MEYVSLKISVSESTLMSGSNEGKVPARRNRLERRRAFLVVVRVGSRRAQEAGEGEEASGRSSVCSTIFSMAVI